MQQIAVWLVAKPLNAVLALAATVTLPYVSLLSGVTLILLVLKVGARLAAIEVALAGAVVTLIGVVLSAPLELTLANTLSVWVPAYLLAVLLQKTRSLTLTLQVSVLIAVLAMSGFYLAVDNPAEFWRDVWTVIAEAWREAGLVEQADLVVEQMATLTQQMTLFVTFISWFLHAISCVLGYLLYRQLPGETADYGQFRELNFGRVIAVTLAIASVAAFLTGSVWLQSVAFVMFLVFWLQGLAVLHWMHAAGHLPVFGVIAVYVLMPILNAILVMSLAVVGYIDAWFRLRRNRIETKS